MLSKEKSQEDEIIKEISKFSGNSFSASSPSPKVSQDLFEDKEVFLPSSKAKVLMSQDLEFEDFAEKKDFFKK